MGNVCERLGRRSMTAMAAVVLTLGAGSAFADLQPPAMSLNVDVTGDGAAAQEYDWTTVGQVAQQDSGGWLWQADTIAGNGNAWSIDEWSSFMSDGSSSGGIAGGIDPVTLNANFVVTNNSNSTETFQLVMTLASGVVIQDALMAGSVVGTVTDLTFDDATVTAPGGGSIYTSQIDGVDVQTLLDDPFSQNAGGALQSSEIGPADYGTPDPIASGQDLDTSITIVLEFTLTAGDSASFSAVFEVVPAPAALPVLAAFGFFARRRRRA
jgi:hypothetical protein